MRVAALYDIHGNLPALEAVLEDVRRAEIDLVVIGGDVVPGPMPGESIDCVRALGIPTLCIRGNGEREVLAFREGTESSTLPQSVRDAMRWVAATISDEQAQFLESWPTTLRVELPELGPVLFCHATPRSDTEIITRLTSPQRMEDILSGTDASLVVCGHTHMQFERVVGRWRVVNAGSVGMPFGAARADWLLLGGVCELRHTTYDLDNAVERIATTAYPQAREFANDHVLHPPSEDRMLELFARADRAGA